jgi:hypothetical protein
MNFQACTTRARPTIECPYPVISIAWRDRRAAGCTSGGPETITTNTMILERLWSFNAAALNRGKGTTEMLSLGIIKASPGIIRMFSVYFSV